MTQLVFVFAEEYSVWIAWNKGLTVEAAFISGVCPALKFDFLGGNSCTEFLRERVKREESIQWLL